MKYSRSREGLLTEKICRVTVNPGEHRIVVVMIAVTSCDVSGGGCGRLLPPSRVVVMIAVTSCDARLLPRSRVVMSGLSCSALRLETAAVADKRVSPRR